MNNKIVKSKITSSKEFKFIKTFIFPFEVIEDVIVGEVNEFPHLLVLSDQRLFLKAKEVNLISEYKQFGLEEIIDIKAVKLGKYTDLTFFISNKEFIKINYIENNQALEFINSFYRCRNEWISSF